MKRATLYSRSVHAQPAKAAIPAPQAPAPAAPESAPSPRRQRLRAALRRTRSPLLIAAGAVFALLLVYVHGSNQPVPRVLTQKDIDSAVLRTLETKPLP